MKLAEILAVQKSKQDTTSCGTTYSGQNGDQPQDIVSQDIVPETINGHIVEHEDHSAGKRIHQN